MTTPHERRQAIVNEYNQKMAKWIASLPEVPFEHRCKASGWQELQWVEDLSGFYDMGIERADDGHKVLRAITDGWDDISEAGSNGHVMCTACHQCWRAPDDFTWN